MPVPPGSSGGPWSWFHARWSWLPTLLGSPGSHGFGLSSAGPCCPPTLVLWDSSVLVPNVFWCSVPIPRMFFDIDSSRVGFVCSPPWFHVGAWALVSRVMVLVARTPWSLVGSLALIHRVLVLVARPHRFRGVPSPSYSYRGRVGAYQNSILWHRISIRGHLTTF